ncbi:MAG: radical SAM protein [bacterium]|nr:radical SAM protein [bacterium]
MRKKYCILDCFVDEPACFGVPPFISPYPRYIYGALIDAGTEQDDITFYTIDHLRKNDFLLEEDFELVFLIGGAVVPGKYLGSKIGSISEINRILGKNPGLRFAAGSPLQQNLSREHANIIPLDGDIEKFAFECGKETPVDAFRTTDEIGRWAQYGAPVVRYHPDFPSLVCEIETYRGCPRQQHCSFCSEGLFSSIEFRQEDEILTEIDALIKQGISRFRIGRQADILQYKTPFSSFKNGFSQPDPAPVSNLFAALKERKLRGDITVLNIDNGNPGTIANFPEESSRILEAIVDAITPGDTLPLGIESIDPVVIAQNNLKVTGEEALRVVQLINDIGSRRVNGIPVLLPGINLIHGLRGESMTTFRDNYDWLMSVKEAGLLIKRINIRKLLPFPGTGIYSNPPVLSKKILNRFEYYRSKIRHDIDTHMLKQIYPAGTILRDSHILDTHAGYSYGKQPASYSITVKLPLELELKSVHTVMVLGHRERSLMALPVPSDINSLPQKALEQIPGISKKKSSEIILKRPFSTTDEIREALETVPEVIKDVLVK